ncbi:MAG: DUF418 domain-containing protein [Williamsia sp.]|nr:DUF418 domain-containing protein [Williamsia sp.]
MIQTPFTTPAGGQQQRYAWGHSRILSLDVLRGLALLAALFISIWTFGGFSTNQQNGLLLKTAGWNYRLYVAVSLLLEGKMQALIALVFGASMVLFLSANSLSTKLPLADRFIRRQMWLIIFGLVNALLLLWTNDLLFHLGIMGILLFPFIRLSARGLLLGALFCTLIYMGKNEWNYADHKWAYQKYLTATTLEKKLAKQKTAKKDSLSKQQKADREAWEGIVKSKKWDPKADEERIRSMQTGGYGKLWRFLLPNTQARESQWTYREGIWDLSAMMLLGMGLLKGGFFTRRLPLKRYILVTTVGLIAGFALGWFRLHTAQLAVQDYTKFITRSSLPANLFFPLEKAFVALGYASLVVVLIESKLLSFVWRALAAAGKMTLSNYLLQSILCTLFFTGFGMGYYGRLSQHELYFFTAEVILLELVFSVLWLRRFQTGPVEWFWRYLVEPKHPPAQIPPSTPPLSSTIVPSTSH